MQDEHLFAIEVVPKIEGFTCKVFLYLFYLLITFTPLLAGFVIWYLYNIYAGIAFFLFLTLIGGIVLSKLRVASIPIDQREMTYSNFAIIKWYLGKNVCLD